MKLEIEQKQGYGRDKIWEYTDIYFCIPMHMVYLFKEVLTRAIEFPNVQYLRHIITDMVPINISNMKATIEIVQQT